MRKYRKLPVEIEALQYAWNNRDEVLRFINSEKSDNVAFCAGANIEINTLEGKMLAQIGDFIVKGVHGEFYPCKPDIFAKTYEVV